MRLEVSLAQKLSLQLKLAPQIIQSIEILQLPALSLLELIEQELVENEGLERKDLRLEVQEGVLVVGGEKKHEEETRENGCYHVERSFGSFTRTLPLPRGVDVAKAEATLEHGVLKVRFPRTAEKETTRKIEVKAT